MTERGKGKHSCSFLHYAIVVLGLHTATHCVWAVLSLKHGGGCGRQSRRAYAM